MNLEVTKEKALATYASCDDKGKKFLEGLFGKAVFITDITELIKTFADACQYLGFTEEQFKKVNQNLEPDEYAFLQLKYIAKALNGGTNMEYDGKTYMYYPYFNSAPGFSFVGYCSYSISYVSSRLCLPTSKLAIYFGKQFVDIWKIYIK